MMPTVEQLKDAANSINQQQPSLSGAPRPEGACDNEQDGNGMRVLRLTAEQVLTISLALGVATGVALREGEPAPVQMAWAGIIDSALMARGAAGVTSATLAALARVDVETLERMARLVLGPWLETGERIEPPDTPESAAAKARAAHGALCALREVLG